MSSFLSFERISSLTPHHLAYVHNLFDEFFSSCCIITITFEGCFVWLTASLSQSPPAAAAAAAASTPVDSLSYPLLVGSLYLMTDIDK